MLDCSDSDKPRQVEDLMDYNDDVLKRELEKWMAFKYLRLSEVFVEVKNLFQQSKFEMSNLKIFDVERSYVEILLQNWFNDSRISFSNYLEKIGPEDLRELPNLLKELDLFKTISQLKTAHSSSNILKWCSGKLFDLILEQDELFDLPYANHLMFIRFNQFKTICIQKLFSVCLDSDLPKHLNFVSALNDFLAFLNVQPELPNILDDSELRNNFENDNLLGRDLIDLLIERYCLHQFSSVQDLPEPIKRLKRLLYSLQKDDWNPKFETLTKEICKKHLLPLVTYEDETEGGRRIFIIKGTVIVISQIKSKLLKQSNKLKAEEIQIIGVASVHVDCDLENNDWHGMNIAVVTDKLFVVANKDDAGILWDVSGQNNDYNFNSHKAQNGKVAGDDGLSGEHGLPGESGGNIFIVCNEMFNAERWKIVSNGGRGSAGQDGGNGKNWSRIDHGTRLTIKKFHQIFPPKSAWFQCKSYKEMDEALKTFEQHFPSWATDEEKDIRGENYFFIRRNTKNGHLRITASLWKNHAFILLQAKTQGGQMGGRGGEGGKGGQGGYGGTITIRKLNGGSFIVRGLTIGDKLQSKAVTTGARGSSGPDGCDGKGGEHGKPGKTEADIGVIDNINNRSNPIIKKPERIYFGFDKRDNQHFEIEYLPVKDDNRQEIKSKLSELMYTKCNPSVNTKMKYYAVLQPPQDLTKPTIFVSTNPIGRKEIVSMEATKKKAITRQSLAHHISHTIERKSTIQYFKKMTIGQLTLPDLLAYDIEVILKQTQEEQSIIASWTYGLDRIHQQNLMEEDEEQITIMKNKSFNFNAAPIYRKSIDSRQHVLNYCNNISKSPALQLPKLARIKSSETWIDVHDDESMDVLAQLEQTWIQTGYYTNMIMQHMASFLEHQPTFDYDKPKSLFHAALGSMDESSGFYVFQFSKSYKRLLEKLVYDDRHLRENRNMLMDFLLHLEHNEKDPVNSKKYKSSLAMRDKYLDQEFSLENCLPNIKRSEIILSSNGNSKQDKDLYREYLKFVHSEAMLSLRDVLEISRPITIHVYENCAIYNQDGSREYYEKFVDKQATHSWLFKITNNYATVHVDHMIDKYILCKGNGYWERADFNQSMKMYFKERAHQFNKFEIHYHDSKRTSDVAVTSWNPKTDCYHRSLLEWLKGNQVTDDMMAYNQMMTSIKMLNPDYGSTPDELSRLLLKHYKHSNEQQLVQLAANIPLLVERIMDYNIRSIEPIFYLCIVDILSPNKWECEFLLFQLEERMKLVLQPEVKKLWREYLFKLDDQKLFLLRHRLREAEKPGSPLLVQARLERTLNLLTEDLDLTDEDVTRLGYLSLNDWFFELISKIWIPKLDQLSSETTSLEEKKEAIYMLVELTNMRGKEFSCKFLENFQSTTKRLSDILRELEQQISERDETSSEIEEKTTDTIISKIEGETCGNTSKKLALKLPDIKTSLLTIQNKLENDFSYTHQQTSENMGILTNLIRDYRESIFTDDKAARLLARDGRLPEDSFYKLRKKIWAPVVEKLFTVNQDQSVPFRLDSGQSVRRFRRVTSPSTSGEQNEAVYLFIELANKRGDAFCNQFVINSLRPPAKTWPKIFEQLELFQQSVNTEDISALVDIISNEDTKCVDVGDSNSNRILKIMFELSSKKVFKLHTKSCSRVLTEKYKKEIQKTKGNPPPTIISHQQDQEQFLLVYIYAVQVKMNIQLRQTQRVAIMTLLSSGNNTLAQVSTGEGKSLIVAALAIYYALHNNKIDIITSNNVLAKRDSSLSIKEGGLKDLYKVFNVDVAHNCSEAEHDRVKAYDSAVVYGELSNFQRDYLLDKCYGCNIRGDRTFDCVIVDEVDCMLLDRGNNMLYLSHDIPGMEMLESLYVFIWEMVHTMDVKLDSTQNRKATSDAIKSAVLYDLYGTISIDDLMFVHGPLEKNLDDKKTLWCHLIKTQVIDKDGRLLIEEFDEITKDNIKYSEKMDPKLNFFFCNVLERKRHIRIPKHLLPFIDRHLDNFIDNAIRALMLNSEEHYVVDYNRSDNSEDFNPQVIIIDPDTGTDQTTSQWDGGLHQFLQLKEGCRLTLQNFKSVFVSNVTFIKRYKRLAGLSGTLGSQPERTFLQELYECDYFTVPSFCSKRFNVQPAIVLKTEKVWLQTIIEETRQIIDNEKRSLVIFCRSIQLVKTVYQSLRRSFPDETVIRSYTRDYEKFSLGNENGLDIGQVIVATNLAGRGTDIKISDTLRKNGGLHICLTFLPENVRIEEQAMGRAGRKGDPGSCKLILWESDSDDSESNWSRSKIFDMKMERNRQEMQRISKLSHDISAKLDKQEECFKLFWKHYEKLTKKLSENVGNFDLRIVDIICNSVLDRWALWLDQFDDGGTLFESLSLGDVLCKLKNEVIDTFPNDIGDPNRFITPARSIVLAKSLTMLTKKSSYNKAASLLDEIIKSKDSSLYPAAHYYRAMVYMNSGEFKQIKNSFIQLLRTTETLLYEHITTQMCFSATISQIRNGTANKNLSQPVEAYKEQKDNIIKLLLHYTTTIHSILGTHCSVSGLQDVGINNKETAEEYFNCLINRGCIVNCRINAPETVPNRDSALQKIANDYNVNLEQLEDFLNNINNLTEKEVSEEFKNTDMIPCTRRKFWDLLVEEGALLKPSSTGRLNSSEFQDPNLKYVIFNPSPEIINQLLGGNTPTHEDFEYARLDLQVLKTVDLTRFGCLNNADDLTVTRIAQGEREKVWEALIDQKIINRNGSLSSNYNNKDKSKFSYADCPVYEDAVLTLVDRTYVAELIRRQWLDEQDSIQRIKTIGYLPLDSYQDMLSDLQAAYIISGNIVTDNSIDVKDIVKEITKNKDDRKPIETFLKNHQADYASAEKPTVSLESVEHDIWNNRNKVLEQTSIELNTFNLVGFNHIIKISDKKWSKDMILRNTLILFSGVFFVLPPVLLLIFPMTGILNAFTAPASGFLLKKGVGDITFAISSLISGQNITWADSKRRLLNFSLYFPEQLKSILSYLKRLVFKNEDKSVELNLKKTAGTNLAKQINADSINITRLAESSCLRKIDQTMKLDRLNLQVVSIVNTKLKIAFCRMEAELVEEISKKMFFTTEMNETLDVLGELKGLDEVCYIAELETDKFSNQWGDMAQLFLDRVMDLTSSKLKETAHKYQLTKNAAGDEIREHHESLIGNEIIQTIEDVLEKYNIIHTLGCGTKTNINCLYEEIKTYIPQVIDSTTAVAAKADSKANLVKPSNQFMDLSKSKLNDKAKEKMTWFKRKLMEKSAEHVVTLTNNVIKKMYRERIGNLDANDWLTMEQHDPPNEIRGTDHSDETPTISEVGLASNGNQSQESRHIQLCLELMKETNDPVLLAALIREGKVPHDDAFCKIGLQEAVKLIQHKIPNLTTSDLIKCNERAVDMIENDLFISCSIRLKWREFTKKQCPFELFPVLKYGCTDAACELRGLTEYPGYHIYVKQAFIGSSDADSFNNMRKFFLGRGDYRNVIWQTIKTFLLPVVKRLKNEKQIEKFVDAATKHFQKYSNSKRDEVGTDSVITLKEADELKKCLELNVFDQINSF